MVTSARRSGDSYRHAATALAERLREQLGEIEYAVVTRVRAVAPFDAEVDPEYVSGLRKAIRAAIEYCLNAIEDGIEHGPPIPTDLIAQARVAARHNVALGTVVRRCGVSSSQIRAFVVQEAQRDTHFHGDALGRLLEELDAVLERLFMELEHEYGREPQVLLNSSEARLLRRVERRLAGEPVDLSDLNYDFDGHHIGAVAEGEDGAKALRALAKAIDARILPVRADDDVTWAWIGTRRPVDRGEFDRHVTSNWPVGVPLGLGVLGWGPSAWRLTHEQGKDAFAFALRGPHAVVRHAEVAVVAAVERDPLASASLRQLYVTPFERMGDRGPDLLRTLGAYLSAGRNGQAAAGALGVSRQAVSDRLRSVERILGKPISAWGADLEIALRLERTQRRTDRLESRRERPKANSRTGT